MRTLLYMYVFDWSPTNTIEEIYYLKRMRSNYGHIAPKCINFTEACDLWDTVVGKNFSVVAQNVAIDCYNEYKECWQAYPFNNRPVNEPNIDDYASLFEFVNIEPERCSFDQYIKQK